MSNHDIIILNDKSKNELSISKIRVSNYDITTSFYDDIKNILYRGCQYYPHLIAKYNDFSLFDRLKNELSFDNDDELILWSKHHKIENPENSQTFNLIVDTMKNHFNIDILQTRLNYYTNTDYKPFHHDSHAYTNGIKENITIGCSFGNSRSLSFKHVETGRYFNFEQNNGDVFCFDHETNKKFQHGIPKLRYNIESERISIILWGKQKTPNNDLSSVNKIK
jgi:hypothetical protein